MAIRFAVPMKLIVNPFFSYNGSRRLKAGRGSGGGISSGGNSGNGGSGSGGDSFEIGDQSSSNDVIELIYQYLSLTLEQEDLYSGDKIAMPTPNFTVTEFNGTILKLELKFDDRYSLSKPL